MASIEQPRVSYQRSDWEAILSRAYTINWEVAVYGVILVVAILTRFWDLGERVMSHDESLHVYYSWKLYDQGDFQHTPLMHGPVIFHVVAFFYFLFGDSDFSARIYPAILGIGIVMFPLLFRRWLGKFGAIFASIGLLISPMMMYYSRYIREDIPMLFYMLVMIYGFMQYIEGNPPRQLKWLVVMSGGMLLMMASKEVAFMNMAIYGSFLVLYWLLRLLQESPLRRRPLDNLAWEPPQWQTLFGHGLVLGIAVILGFFLGELLYWWQYATMDWVWVGLGVGVVLLVRLMTLAWDAVVRQTQSSSRDLINVVLSTLSILGVLLAMFGSYQYYDKSNQIDEIQQKAETQGLTTPETAALVDLQNQRNLSETIGFAGLLISVFTITGLIFTYVMTTNVDGELVLTGKLKRKRKNEDGIEEAPPAESGPDGMSWLITTVAVVAVAALILVALRWLSTDIFTYWLRRLPEDWNNTVLIRAYFPLIRHTILDFGSILAIYLGLNSLGYLRTFLAEEPRPGVAQMLTDGLTRTKSTLLLVMAGTIIGGILALHVFGVLDILKPDQIFFRPSQATLNAETGETITYYGKIDLNEELGNALLVWVGLPILFAIGTVIITAMLATPRRMALPWMDILTVLLVALIVGGILVYAERQSHLKEEEEESEQPVAVDPNQVTIDQPQEKYEKGIIYAATGFALLAALGVMLWRVYLPHTWDYLERQSVFGVLITLGALLLPWLSALPIWLAEYKLDAAPLPGDTERAAFLVTGSWLILSFTVAISWNWRYWLIAVTVFLGLFLFFFTTVFTNGAGVLTGMVGSLGYWLEQQGVRRGSQPQYYYTLIQVPMYEFLPLVLASLAGLFGLGYVFRWRATSRQMELAEAGQDIHDRHRVQTAPLDMHAIMQEQAPLPGYRPRRQTDRLLEIEGEPLIEVERPDPMAIFNEDMPDGELPVPWEEQTPPPFWAQPYDHEEELALRSTYPEWLGGVPFLPMLGYWAIIIFVGLTYAGEKMPWLTTHITVPLTLIAGWFVGYIVEKIHWDSLKKGGWALLLILAPVLLISMVELIFPLIGRNQPFQGSSQPQLQTTYEWLAAVLVFLAAGYYSLRMIGWVTWGQTWRIAFASMALLLAVLAGRAAFMASFKNYDYPTEFLVYAHSGPNVKDTLDQIEYIASRMNEGTNLRLAFDDDSSWPMTWYLRDYNYAYFGGDAASLEANPGVLSGARVVIVGGKKNEAVERILGDQYYRYDLIRLWWPMQEYFSLNHERIMNLFDDARENPVAEIYRQGIWNIWWERDYELYSVAQCVERQQLTCEESGYSSGCMNEIIDQCEEEDNRYDLRQWPVSDHMYVYIDKDYVTEIWDAGIGGETVENREPVDEIGRVYREVEPMNIFGTAYSLRKSRGIEVADNGNVYVADTENSRIMVFDPEGNLVTTFGVPSTQDNIGPGTLFQPWGVAIAEDGRIFVADTWNHRIAVFDSAGVPITMWGYYGTPDSMPNDPYAMFGPRDIEIDLNGHILVADTGGKRVRVYTPEGQWLHDIGGGGSGSGQLEEPVGLAVNPVSGHVFVADTWNRRIQEFDEEGNPVRFWEVEMWFDNRNSNDRPYLAFSPDGTLLAVSDMNSSGRNDGPRIVVYDLAETPVMALNAPETNFESGQFGIRIVGGLAFAPDGTLYALDSDTGRVVRFPALPVQGSVLPVPRQQEQPPAQDNLAQPTAEPTEEPAADATEDLNAAPTAEPTEEATEASAG